MVRRPAAEHAVSLAGQYPLLSIGLHIDLGEWRLRDGRWEVREWVVDTADRESVTKELEAQLARFRELTGKNPSHLDSHQHVHLSEPVRSVVLERGVAIGVPVRGLTDGIAFRGDFYGRDRRGLPFHEAITLDALVRIIASLPNGVTELGCHPGHSTDLEDDYRDERHLELEVLCHPRVLKELEIRNVRLATHREIRSRQGAAWSRA